MKVQPGETVKYGAAIIRQSVPGVVGTDKPFPSPESGSAKSGRTSFGEILASEIDRSGELKVSSHARRRLLERNVTLGREDMRKIEGAVHRAAAKGSRESLVIYGNIALVASVRNRTIITAMEGKDMEDHIFTNIDSAVIVR